MKKIVLAGLVIVLFATLAFGLPSVQHICGSWDSYSGAASYKLYWRVPGADFTDANSVNVGNVTLVDITDRINVPEDIYEWAVTAVRTDGSETNFSEVILHPFYQTPQGAVTNFTINICE